MDEMPMKAGLNKGKRLTLGNMKQSYFCPMYGEQDEIAFASSASLGMAHANCWAHGHRPFEQALTMEPEAAQYVDTIAALYQK